MTSSPDTVLMQRYGTESVFLEKQADGLSLLERLGGGLAGAGLQHRNDEAQNKHQAQAEQMNEMLRELELARVDQAGQLLRHTPVPRFASSNIPPGWDEGMVRMASVAALVGADMAKEAGMGTMIGGIASGGASLASGLGRGLWGGGTRVARGAVGGVTGAAKGIAGGVSSAAGSLRSAGQSAMGSLKAAPSAWGQKLTNLGQRAETAGQLAGARVQGALTGQQLVSPLKGNEMARAGWPKPAPGPVAAPTSPAAAKLLAGKITPPASLGAGPASAPVAAAQTGAANAGTSIADRLKGKLGLGWKGNLALGATAAGGLYLGSKALQKGTQIMGEEAGGPAVYGAGGHGAQLPFGVNQYGQPQVGTPL